MVSNLGVEKTTTRKSALRKVTFRILPFLFLMYLVNYIDRTVLGFAAANGMNEDLMMTATMFGFASGIFFIGYILLEVPSNLLMAKFGARIWLARIGISWGIIATLTAFIPSFEVLLVARFLLGVAEAGFTPAVLLYLTYWFSNRERAKAYSIFLLGIPISSVVTAPLVSTLIGVGDSIDNFAGWRFLIFVTGIPAILVGITAYLFLSDRPADAKWLTQQEKDVLTQEIQIETDPTAHTNSEWKSALKSPTVWALGLGFMGIIYGLYAIGFFAPSIVTGFAEQFGTTFTNMQNGLIVAIPYFFAAIGMILWARSSAKKQEIGWHVLGSTALGALGILIAAYIDNPWFIMIGVTLCATGVISTMPVFLSLPARILTGTGAAAGLALVNSIGNFGGFAGPFITGWLKDLSGGSVQVPFTVIAVFLVLSAVIAIVIQRKWKAGQVSEFEQRVETGTVAG